MRWSLQRGSVTCVRILDFNLHLLALALDVTWQPTAVAVLNF